MIIARQIEFITREMQGHAEALKHIVGKEVTITVKHRKGGPLFDMCVECGGRQVAVVISQEETQQEAMSLVIQDMFRAMEVDLMRRGAACKETNQTQS